MRKFTNITYVSPRLNPDVFCIREIRSKYLSLSLLRARFLPRKIDVSSFFDPLRSLSTLNPSRASAPSSEGESARLAGFDASTMSARNIAGHHTGARFAMIPRVINNVCFTVNLRLGSNLISTEATRSNADGDWLGGIARSYGTQRRAENAEERRKRKREIPRGKKERKKRRDEPRRKKTNKKGRSALFAAARS